MTRSEAQYYRTLGLTTAASMDDIKQAYRSIARKIHPDRSPGKEEQFKEITAAYNELVDRHGRGQNRGGSRGTPRGGARPAGRSHRGASGAQWGPWKPKSAGPNGAEAGERRGHGPGGKTTSDRHRSKPSQATRQRARATRKQEEANRRQQRPHAESKRPWTDSAEPRAQAKGAGGRRRASDGPQSAGAKRARTRRTNPPGSASAVPPHGRAQKASTQSSRFGANRRRRTSKVPEGRPRSGRSAEEADFWSEQHLGAREETKESAQPEDFNAAWRAWCESAERYHAENGDEPASDERKPVLEPQRETENRHGAGKRLVDWVRRGLRRVRAGGPDLDGEDVVLRLAVSVDQLFHGAELRIAALRPVACPSCQGDGDAGCVCDGTGRIRIRDEVPVTLPAGARSGLKLRVADKGGDGLGEGANGDLILYLDPPELPGFRREGLNLQGTVYVSQRMARLGGTVQLELPRGCVNVKVPPQSRSGDRFRLRGQGVPVWGGGERGDVVLSVVVR